MLTLALGVGGCLSPEEYRQQADSQVYSVLKQRREELGVEGVFTYLTYLYPLQG